MLVEKSNLLQRVRVVMIALVAVIGFGTMAMKPADPTYTYGVTDANPSNWRVLADVSDPESDYTCSDATDEVCKIHTSTAYITGDLVPKSPTIITEPGRFSQ